MSKVRIMNAKVSIGCSPSPREGWTSYRFNFRGFRDLTTTKNHYVITPGFTRNGHKWTLDLYPGGENLATDGYMSIYMTLRSEVSTAATYEITLLDKFGNAERVKQETDHLFDKSALSWPSCGWPNFINRSDILDASKNILDSSGTLAIVVSMKDEPTTAFVPRNPSLNMLYDMFNDDTTADVCFEVEVADSARSFHAHTLILKKYAPMLAGLIPHGNDVAKVTSVQVGDVQPDIFRHLLWYVYGGSVAEDTLKANAKDIIDAANKYSIANLKLEAEAAYVESTTFTAENVLDNLLYAEAMNLALLKEAVIDFIVDNGDQVIGKISFDDVPSHVVHDIVVATTRRAKESKNEATTDMKLMRVSELRRKLDEKGLDVDGSREAMIASLIRSESVGNNATLLEAEDEVNEDEDEDENNAEEE